MTIKAGASTERAMVTCILLEIAATTKNSSLIAKKNYMYTKTRQSLKENHQIYYKDMHDSRRVISFYIVWSNLCSSQVERSPYEQKLAHSHVVPTTGTSGYSNSRPQSATTPGAYGGKPKIDSKYIDDPNLWDPATSATSGRRFRPVSAVSAGSDAAGGRSKIDVRFVDRDDWGQISPREEHRRRRPISAPVYKRFVIALWCESWSSSGIFFILGFNLNLRHKIVILYSCWFY